MLVLLWIEITSQNLYLNLELFLDTTEDNPYCVIVSLVIWIFSVIYFVDFGFFITFSSKEQIYLFTFIFITEDSCFAQVTLISLLLVSSWVTFNQQFCRWWCFSFYWFGKWEFGKFTNMIPVIGGLPILSSFFMFMVGAFSMKLLWYLAYSIITATFLFLGKFAVNVFSS